MLLVLTHLQNNQIDEAEKAALALAERQKDNPVVENLLGVISLRKGGPDEATKHFRRALEIKPDFTPAEMNIAQLETAARRVDKAREIYENILKRDPANEQAMLALANLSFGENKAEDGVLWLEKARNGNPRGVASRLRLVEIYIGRKDAAKAIAVARELTEIAPSDPRSHNALGQAHLAAGEYESAIGEFRRYADLQPNAADPRLQMARVYMAQKDSANARTWLERALEANLGDLDMQQRYTEFAVASQSLDPAIAYARTLVKQHPKEAPADLLLAGLLEVANKPNEALTVYQQAAAKIEHPVVANRLSAAYARAGEPAKAVETLEKWLAKNPNDDRTRFALASLYIAQKKYDAAVREHETLLAGREANSPVILNNLAWLYSLKKDPRALDYAEKAYGMAQTANIADTYGWILLEKGDTARALPILEKAAADAPAAGQIRYHYAVALNKAGRAAEAKRELETVVKGNQPFDDLDAAKSLLKEVGG
jgi:putative PEP-CTERM system TPR-repeat lipoprotein